MKKTAYYQIEQGIPVPARGAASWPYHKLRVGESFIVPRKELRSKGPSLYSYAKRRGWKVVVRSDGNGSARVWRVK